MTATLLVGVLAATLAQQQTDTTFDVRPNSRIEIETFGVTDEAVERLRGDADVSAINIEERDQSQILLVQSDRGAHITQRLLSLLGDTRVGKVVAREPTLEDAYVHLIATTGDDEARSARAASVQ